MRKLPFRFLAAACLVAVAVPAQTTTKVIFLGSSLTFGADGAIMTYLQGRYGAKNVTFQTTEPVGTVKALTLLGYDVAVLSSTPSSGRYRNILHNSPVPIVNMEEAVADNVPANQEYAMTSGRTKEREAGPHSITIRTAHPITAGYKVNQTVQITSTAAEVWWSTGTQATGAKSLASDDDTPGNMFLTYVEVGDQLLDTGRKAECRRVMFGMTDNSFTAFNADGRKLFGQAIDWAANGCCAQWSNYGNGHAGKNGVPVLRVDALPKYGSTVNLIGTNTSGAATVGVIAIGKQAIAVPAYGGTLLAVPLVVLPLPLAATGFTIPWKIPDSSSTCPRLPRNFHEWYFQMLVLDSAAAGGWSFTRGLRIEHGK